MQLPIRSLAVVASLGLAFAQQPIYHAVRQAVADPAVATLAGGVMLSIPGLFTDFILAGGGQFVQLPNGTARLTGRVFSDASLYSALLVDIEFTGRLLPGDAGYPPVGSPDAQLLASAYAPIGTVDVGTFVYYTAATGTLVGVRNLDGAVLGLQSSGTIQVGSGANNRNATPGLQANFTVQVTQQPPQNPVSPTGTASLTLDLATHRTLDTTHPQPDPLRTTLAEGRALVLPGVADDYLFVPAGDFTEFDDGHAELTGTLARLAQLDDAWDVVLTMTNRITPGQAGYPPAGSPVLQMLPSAYVANGGTMDPSHWHYYQTATGTLTGTGFNAGGLLTLTSSVSLQVGGAANQTNTYFGFYGAFATAITTQPTGHTVTITGNAELFGLTAVFPVLPFPTLTVQASHPTLPTLTDQGLVLEGDNLAWGELVGVGWDLVGGHAPSQWFGGWFRVLDNQHIELHPRPGAVPGTYNVAVYTPAIRSNEIAVDLVAPTTPQLFSEAAVASFYTAHVHIHSGTVVGPTLSVVTLSQTLLPSVAPGIASLDIGNQFLDLALDPVIYAHDPLTGIARTDYGPISPSLAGQRFWFQGLVLDFGALLWPLPATNAWAVDF